MLILRIALQNIDQDVLGLVKLAFGFVKNGEHSHDFDGLRELQADHLQEELGPLELLQLASGVEKLLHEVHVVALDEAGMQLDQRHSTLQNQLSMSIKEKRWIENKEVYEKSL